MMPSFVALGDSLSRDTVKSHDQRFMQPHGWERLMVSH